MPQRIRPSDAVVAVLVTALLELELALRGGTDGLATGAAALGLLVLAARRDAPVAALAGVVVTTALLGLAGGDPQRLVVPTVAGIVAAFALGAHGSRRELLAGLLLGSAGMALAARAGAHAHRYALLDDGLWFGVVQTGLPAAAGRLLAHRGRVVAALDARAGVPAGEAAALAADRERARLGGELHDAIAHRVGELAMQAEGADRVADREPHRALEALARIEATARASLRDIRDVLGVLRRGDDGPGLRPQPALTGLEALVDRVTATGRVVMLTAVGDLRGIDPAVGATAYRAVQEALGDATGVATVDVRATATGVRVDVRGPGTGAGDGLPLRQRVALFGGDVRREADRLQVHLPRDGDRAGAMAAPVAAGARDPAALADRRQADPCARTQDAAPSLPGRRPVILAALVRRAGRGRRALAAPAHGGPAGVRRADLAVAAALVPVMAAEVLTSRWLRGPAALNVLAVAVTCAPLAVARARPLGALAATFAAATVTSAALTPLSPLLSTVGLLWAPHQAGLRMRGAGAALGLLTGLAGLCAVYAAGPAAARAAGDALATLAIVALVWGAGSLLGRRERRAGDLHERALGAEDARLAAEHAAVVRERARIARELHDVVAHAMTAIVLQAGAAQRVWHADPARARDALRAVAAVSRETLTHLRHTLPVLGAEPVGPPRLADVEALAVRARAAGLDVAVRVQGTPHPLPAEVELAAYRVVQEALTNAARHAAPTRVEVAVVHHEDAVEVHVEDGGRRGAAPEAPVPGAGAGLRGMRERVEAAGGRLQAGPRRDGGFAVHARLPARTAVPA